MKVKLYWNVMQSTGGWRKDGRQHITNGDDSYALCGVGSPHFTKCFKNKDLLKCKRCLNKLERLKKINPELNVFYFDEDKDIWSSQEIEGEL